MKEKPWQNHEGRIMKKGLAAKERKGRKEGQEEARRI